MKADIHPQWHDDALVTCSSGPTFVTGSTKPEIKVDFASKVENRANAKIQNTGTQNAK